MNNGKSDFNLTHIKDELTTLLGAKADVRMYEPMALHTTFRAGGAADLFVDTDTNSLQSVLRFLKKENIPFVILGNGSNVLVADAGYHGVAVHLRETAQCINEAGVMQPSQELGLAHDSKKTCAQENDHKAGISVKDNLLICDAGMRLGVVAHAAAQAHLDGLVFAAGIPGTIGGALTMNAGAYGGEMKDIVETVTALDLEQEDIPKITLSCAQMHFSYRHSIAAEQKICFTGAALRLTPGNRAEIEKRMQVISAERAEKQPLSFPSAGSTFKRPTGHFAGKLIMDAGLRGYSVGGAQVSEKHCGFVINKGGATATDIYTLITDVQKKVLEDSGVLLEREVILLGEFK